MRSGGVHEAPFRDRVADAVGDLGFKVTRELELRRGYRSVYCDVSVVQKELAGEVAYIECKVARKDVQRGIGQLHLYNNRRNKRRLVLALPESLCDWTLKGYVRSGGCELWAVPDAGPIVHTPFDSLDIYPALPQEASAA